MRKGYCFLALNSVLIRFVIGRAQVICLSRFSVNDLEFPAAGARNVRRPLINTLNLGTAVADTIGSGLEVTWTYHPTRWDNEFFHILFAYEWELTESPAGAKQWTPTDPAARDRVPDAHDPSRRHAPMMLTTDLALRFDPVYGPISMNPDASNQGGSSVDLPVPQDAGLAGLRVVFQWLAWDGGNWLWTEVYGSQIFPAPFALRGAALSGSSSGGAIPSNEQRAILRQWLRNRPRCLDEAAAPGFMNDIRAAMRQRRP